MKQKDRFMMGEGDAWFNRNRERLGLRDPVTEVIEELKLSPKRVLEIGCSNGWRLKKLFDRYSECTVFGVEPSAAAVDEALISTVLRSTADELPFGSDNFDLVIFGFCLYLVDPADLFRVVTEADRVLRDNGILIIHDFAAWDRPFARAYEHADGVLSYHMDHAKLWLAHPSYVEVIRHGWHDGDVTVLRKNATGAFPAVP